MKTARILLFALTLINIVLVPRVSAAPNACIPNHQSCDTNNNICCDSNSLCTGGYCQPKTAACGANTQPCCPSPNPQCGTGMVCTGGYCLTTPSPTQPLPPIPTSIPVPSAPDNPPSGENSPLCGVDNLGVNTAIGCLMAGDPKQLISQLLGWGVVMGIGIAFLMIIFAGFQITTAAGDPKRVKAGQELLTSAISGLLLIVFSIFLLNFIGVSILGLPGFFV